MNPALSGSLEIQCFERMDAIEIRSNVRFLPGTAIHVAKAAT